MHPADLVLAPVRVVRLAGRALDDLHTVAERARRDPDPVDEVRQELSTLVRDLHRLLLVAQRIVDGGEDLRGTGERLDAHTVELIDGGAELTATAEEINAALQQFRAALPELLRTLGVVEDLEDAVETVAETVEPLQRVTRGVGRLTRRRSG